MQPSYALDLVNSQFLLHTIFFDSFNQITNNGIPLFLEDFSDIEPQFTRQPAQNNMAPPHQSKEEPDPENSFNNFDNASTAGIMTAPQGQVRNRLEPFYQ